MKLGFYKTEKSIGIESEMSDGEGLGFAFILIAAFLCILAFTLKG